MDLSSWLSPVVSSILQWVVVAMLGMVSAKLVSLSNGIVVTQKATKVLMREDLIARWHAASKRGSISDEARREWVDDYALYLQLVGKNEYLKSINEKILDIPTGPEY